MSEPWAPQWRHAADALRWRQQWHTLYTPDPPYGHWFAGGTLNLAENCVDRHADGEATAVLWEGEPGDRRSLTYAELAAEVASFARALDSLGVGPGDRVALHLGWLPETVVAMLGCARVGALHTVLPTPLPAEALAERLAEFTPRLLVTQDGAWRHGTILPLKARADEALSAVAGVEHTVVVRRTGVDVAFFAGDLWWHELLEQAAADKADTVAPQAVPAEHPLVATAMATRGGRPVSVVHGTATALAAASAVHRYGLSSGGVFWCAGDISWIGTQVHGVYGPLSWGDTAVMFEGTLDVPNRDRAWEIVRRYGVATLLTSPSVVRRLRGWARRSPDSDAVATLRRVVTLGEALEEELAEWLRSSMPDPGLEVADAWGQIELCGIVTVDRPAAAGSLPDPGFALLDGQGEPVPRGERGELVLRHPWAGTLRALEGAGAADAGRHWRRFPGCYATGDIARWADDRLEFHGRLDEVVSVSGQLVSLTEVREVLLSHPFVAEAEVCERPDARLGRSLAAAVVLGPGIAGTAELGRELLDAVREVLGGLARPRALAFAEELPMGLSTARRRAALATLLTGADEDPIHLSASQILSAARG